MGKIISFLLVDFLLSSTSLEDGSFSIIDWDGTAFEPLEDSSLFTLSLSCLRICLMPSMPELMFLESLASLSSR